MGIASRALRNISRRKMRALLVIIVLSISMSIMIAIPAGIAANQEAVKGLTGDFGDTIRQTQETINRTLTQIDCTFIKPVTIIPIPVGSDGSVVVSANRFISGETDAMNQSYYSHIDNITGVAAIAPILQVTKGHEVRITTGTVEPYNITVPDYAITGVPLNASLIANHPILPINITAGRNLQADERGSVVLSENCSAHFGKTVGETVTILNQTFTVVGIYGATGYSDNRLVYMNLADAQAITNKTDTMTLLKVFATSPDVVSSVANAIKSRYPELGVQTAQDYLSSLQAMQSLYDSQLTNAQEVLNQTRIQAYIEMGIAVSATSLIVLFVMLYSVRDRTKEIGTLKAIGASNMTVMGQFLLEGVSLSLIAGAVGVAIGTIAAPYLTSALLPTIGDMLSKGGGLMYTGGSTQTMAITVNPTLVLTALGASVLLGALGSLYPAWRAARIRPAEAMRYE